MAELTTFLTEHTEHFARLEKAAALAEWEVATTGIEEANRRAADTQAQIMRLYANTDEFERVDKWLETGAASDPHIARELRQLHLAYKGGQQDEDTIDALTEMSKEVRGIFNNFRPRYRGREASDNDLVEVLKRETD